jgi:hypothetical protein
MIEMYGLLKKPKSINRTLRQAQGVVAEILGKERKEQIYRVLTLRTLRLLSVLCGLKGLFQQPNQINQINKYEFPNSG